MSKHRKYGFTVDGKMTYREYIKSEAWELKKLQYRRSGLYTGACKACGSTSGIHLHHRSYQRLGQEYLQDLVELCGPCHMAGHEQGLDNWKMPKLLRKAAKKEMRSGKRRERIDKFNETHGTLIPGAVSTLTKHMLHGVASQIGGWNKNQLFLLGVQWPPRNGWLKSLVGKEITAEVWQRVVSAI